MSTELSPEERARIYQEEKARLDAQKQIQQKENEKVLKGCLWVVVGCFALAAIGILFSSNDESTETTTIQLNARVYRTITQIEVTNNDAYTWTDIRLRLNPGITSAYVYKLSMLKAGETIKIGYLNFVNSDGERFNPLKWQAKELHIIAETEKGTGTLAIGWKN